MRRCCSTLALMSRPQIVRTSDTPEQEWDEAIAFGIDAALIESNLRLTPAERIRELVEMNRLHHDIQARTLSAEERERLGVMELQDKLARLGSELVSGLAPGPDGEAR